MILPQSLLAIAWMILLTLATWRLIRRRIHFLSRTEKAASTLVLGVMFSSWASFILWYTFGQGFGTICLALLALTLIALDWRWYRNHMRHFSFRKALRELLTQHRYPSVLLLITMIFFAVLTQRTMLPIRDGTWYSSGPSWGDMMLHLTLASHFVEAGVRDLTLPIFPASKLTYPFLIDLHAAQLFTITKSWQISFGLPTLSLLAAFAVLLYRLAWRLSHSRLASTLWPMLVLGSGSAAGIISYLQDYGAHLASFADYANLGAARPETQQVFANITTAQLLPQRSYLIGICVSFVILHVLTAIYRDTTTQIDENRERRSANLVATLIGLLPLIHVHSFLVMSVLMLGFVYIRWQETNRPPSVWLRAAFVAIMIAAPQIIWQTQSTVSSNFTSWRFGWLTAPTSNVLIFWLINLGLLLPAIIAAGIYLWRHGSKKSWQHFLYLMGLMLFLACNLYIFQPNPWDNMKLLSYGYIFLTLPVAIIAAKISKQSLGKTTIVLIAMIIILTPGSLSLIRQIKVSDELLTREDVSTAAYIRANTPPSSRFLTTPHHNNPVATLGGRSVVMGYTGWLWTYGIDFAKTQRLESAAWSGSPEAKQAIEDLHVDYIAVSRTDIREYGINESFLDKTYPLTYSDNGWKIYRVNQK